MPELSGFGTLFAAVGILLAAAALVTTRSISVALPILLDFLLVAGLLHLSVAGTWSSITAAAIVIVVRKTATRSLRGWAASGSAPRAPQLRRPSAATVRALASGPWHRVR